MDQHKKQHRGVRYIGRSFALLGTTLAIILAILVGVVWVLEKGPSPTITELFCRSVRETSAMRWVANVFLTDEEIDQFKSQNTETLATDSVNTSLIRVQQGTQTDSETGEDEDSGLELIDIAQGTIKGKLLIVKDPSRVILGTSNNFGQEAGLQLTDMVAKYDGIAGINGGGFNDENGRGNGGIPQGLVINEGELVWGSAYGTYNVIGFDANHILHVGTMTGQEAMDRGLYYGVSFVTHDGLASALVINGEVQYKNLSSGVNPRTAIGQCADGSVLLLVLDGRSINTLGATMEDICNVMLEYGAINVGNLDGGSSTVMVYEGEIINACASVTGPRNIPTGFIVLKEG